MMFLTVIAVSTIVPMIAALAFDWLWLAASGRRLALIAALIVPALALACCVYLFAEIVRDPGPPTHDASGMAIVVIMTVGPAIALAGLVFGVPAATLTMRYLRGGGGGR